MAAHRTSAVILNNASTTGPGTAATVGAGYGGTIGLILSQSGAPGSPPAAFYVSWTAPSGNTYQIPVSGTFAGPGVAGGIIYPSVDIPIGAQTVNVVFTAPTTGTCTITAEASWVDTI